VNPDEQIDELTALRRIAALARGYLREQNEGTRVEEHAYRSRLVAVLTLVDTTADYSTGDPTELRRCVAELVAQVSELEAVVEEHELRAELADDRARDAAELAALDDLSDGEGP
jgi:hypothetical protein